MAAHDDAAFETLLPHPGEPLREDFLNKYGLTAGALAKVMGLKDRTRIVRKRILEEGQLSGPVLPAAHDRACVKTRRILTFSPLFVRHSRAEACDSTLETREPSRPDLDASP